MSEKLIIPLVLTSPMPWGVKVEWKWPEGSAQYSHIEIQYLYSGCDLKKKILGWPCESMTIGGLKAGERLQIRLRPIDKNGAVRDWMVSDWIEGVSSSNAEEYLNAMAGSNDMRLMTTLSAPHFKIFGGEVFINDAFIKNSIQAAKLSSSPTISSLAKPREKVRSIVASYMSGPASEFIEDMVDDLMNLAYLTCSEDSTFTYGATMNINCTDAQPASGADSNIDGISFEVSDKDMVVNLAGGGRIVISNWGDSSTMVSKALPPLAHTASLGMSSNDIAEQTLSAVLATILSSVSGDKAEEAAIITARAVRAAFNALGNDNASPR